MSKVVNVVLGATSISARGDKRKLYRFNTLDDSLKVDDLVVVKCNNQGQMHGLYLARIANESVSNKSSSWIVGKVDTDEYDSMIDTIHQKDKIRARIRTHLKEDLTEQFVWESISGTDERTKELLDELNSI